MSDIWIKRKKKQNRQNDDLGNVREGDGAAEVHRDSAPGNIWVAQYLNASDEQKNAPGLFSGYMALLMGKLGHETVGKCRSRPKETFLSSP